MGDAGFLIALFLLFTRLPTLDFVAVFQRAPEAFAYGGAGITAIALFLFVGATGKSAQIPLYAWLPDAMGCVPLRESRTVSAVRAGGAARVDCPAPGPETLWVPEGGSPDTRRGRFGQ